VEVKGKFVGGKKEGKEVGYDEEGNITYERCYLTDISVDLSLCE
jgi:hypothetical protein